ncbi:MAG: arylsulfatase [Bacteroidetes bacterium]|nr:arylsulfatase [Bacteroidota bacterium]
MRLTICLLVLLSATSIQTRAQKPNIVFILADDLGYGDVGYQGQTKIQTPNIDNLARQGMRFMQFYAGATVCAPSRASLLTGYHTGHTPIRGNRGFKPEGQFPLPDSTTTIATILRQHGYTTGIFGKWGLGYPGSGSTPTTKGFTDFFGYNCQTEAHNYYPDHLWDNDKKIDLPEHPYSADLIHRHAMQFLKAQHEHPFFLFLAYTIPHANLQGPHDSIYQHYAAQFNEPAPAPHASFAAMVSRLDHYVGEIVDQLKAQGLDKNTLLIFSSDNGPHHEGGGDPGFFNSSGSLRGIKRDLYEGGIRVPFIAVWKDRIKAGSINTSPTPFWDLFPTFEELAGIPVTKGIDGLSILPQLECAPAQQQKQHPYLYWEFHESGGRQAVRWGKWKGVRLNVNIVDKPTLELYDLTKDPKEEHNIAAQNPAVVRQIETYMSEAHLYNKDWPLLKSEGQLLRQ